MRLALPHQCGLLFRYIFLPVPCQKLVFWAVLARHSPSAAGPETLAPGLIRRIAKSDERVCALLILTPHLIHGIRDKGVFYLFGLTLNIISSIFHRWPRWLSHSLLLLEIHSRLRSIPSHELLPPSHQISRTTVAIASRYLRSARAPPRGQRQSPEIAGCLGVVQLVVRFVTNLGLLSDKLVALARLPPCSG
ncbi:hypothetical protein Droror1_Dr00024845 [Drosera rotundifolia]